jgi:hypothetical protein
MAVFVCLPASLSLAAFLMFYAISFSLLSSGVPFDLEKYGEISLPMGGCVTASYRSVIVTC